MDSAHAGLMPESMAAPSGTVPPAPTLASGSAAMSAWAADSAEAPIDFSASSEAFSASPARASKAARRQRTKKSSSLSLTAASVAQASPTNGIAAPLAAEGGHRAVAGNEFDIVAQRPELAPDRIDQGLVVAARKIGAADAAGEQHVADQGQLRRRVEEHHMARRVAGGVQHLQGFLADRDGVAVFQPARPG
jgi:hypothetical protein